MSDAIAGMDAIPFPQACQDIDAEDISAVVDVLQSDWLTTGPRVDEFESEFARHVGAREAVAVSSGTAALHAAVFAAGIGEGDEVIMSPMTFVATANAVLYQRGKPVFADVSSDTLLLDPAKVEDLVCDRTRAIMAVDYAGQPCDYDALRKIADRHGLSLLADSAHALGATFHDRSVGTLADLTTFSFHPVKHITTGEGGMVVTENPDAAERMRCFRSHGIDHTARKRQSLGAHHYDMVDMGYNYRITDFQCALGLRQLRKAPANLDRRRRLASQYSQALASIGYLTPLALSESVEHAFHLFVVQFDTSGAGPTRDEAFNALRAAGISANVHYPPVHLHDYYRRHLGLREGLCPVAEDAYRRILSLPLMPSMTPTHIDRVAGILRGLGT